MTRKILVTSALPYANGSIHLGHMVEHIQTDVWVRFQKLRGNECHYCCADDTHGTPVMLAAQKQGIAPEDMIAKVREEHLADFTGFFIGYDNYYSTHSPENKQFSQDIYRALKANGKIESRVIEQLFDPEKQMFLPDRFVKGECPKCHAQDQYGDNCEVCGTTYSPTELINPYSAVSGAKPELRESEHFFFKLGECADFLKAWTSGNNPHDGKPHLQAEALNKMKEWLGEGEETTLSDWDISRDAPYFGFEIPDAPGKYFYVWLDAPVGYMASFKNLCDRIGVDFDEYFKAGSQTEMYHFIGKDILYFHALFWPAMLHFSGHRAPTGVYAHGFLTVDGQKMSKSRGTFITAKSYLEQGLNPEWMRYYIAAKLNSKIEDIDLNLQDFISRVNSDLVGKYVNIAARASGFIAKRFEGRLKDVADSALLAKLAAESDTIAEQYENREYARALRDIMALADAVNEYVDANKPWELAKQEGQDERLHEVCSELINAFTMLTAYLAPVLPQTAANAAKFLNLEAITWANTRETLGKHAINKYKHLMQRVEQKQVDDLIEANKQSIAAAAAPAAEESKYEKVAEQASFDDFMKIDMRVAKVLNCEAVEGSTKLLKFDLDFGFEQRIIFSGIAASYLNPAELNGRMVIAVANFAPRKMAKFGVSEGMILSAATADGKLKLLDVDAGAQPGDKVG
ncbi:TPA: methionine--tRNA ligase [Neisseria meningitidis]|uniref:Methionine--tRNA ligase n=2 Tax=Neisseria meningitidis TaxID=487 RepID=SYM_NEIM0|nr:methionine--tRNA ligase [Neisseria meningitidis]A9LZS9.2 RecName: Full=Methionine--tRNA ligase; AltName: Full=Methionyl-tRNA synthetase; Short=MetRS [Neisseria meningitidis 053442]MBG8582742.1 methionine--tRNA ligase [Neisseria meningitidis]MBH2503604.1 methionine--tRNA ligase [Neisseria meningitidis]MBH6075219.1 methionine--tRNA ligase [Neisseria meningitidis]MBH6080968.1 methionine--tRNA ligase [Neisseria meningitidis]MBJ7810954.1 methionine--tRNA ligase [Neisseria meningitidis]